MLSAEIFTLHAKCYETAVEKCILSLALIELLYFLQIMARLWISSPYQFSIAFLACMYQNKEDLLQLT